MNPVKLEFWATHNYNVLFEGHHGTGKTASVKEIFNRVFGEQGVDWLYFSAATMDAWVDFVGVPREVQDEDGMRYLDLIRPRALAKNTVKAIFFDEFNRAPAKTRNAVMELLQFKSINGKRFDNLKVIWAAINPDGDDVYDVERLDPAQQDRFEVKVKVPYDVNRSYFFEKYGKSGEAICDWWRNLDEDVRHTISPRRLEACLKMFLDGGDITDVLPEEGVNVQELIVQLQDGSYINLLLNYLATNNVNGAKEALVNENFYNGVEQEILNTSKNGLKYIEFCLPIMPNEKLAKIVNVDMKARDWLVSNEPYSKYAHIFDPIIAINTDKANRDKNGIATSTISKLKQWKRKSGGDDLLSDAEYIDMVSDSRMNIEFFKNDEERVRLLDRLCKIIDTNTSLTKVEYLKMLGPMVELYRSNINLPKLRNTMLKLETIFSTNFHEHLFNLMDASLAGLRSGSNPAAFASAKAAMVKDGVLNEPV